MAAEGKYKIIKKLESGGMAEVFHAEYESMEGFKKQVAIKRVLPHLSQNREFIAMFLDEARLSLKLNHANIVQTFDIGFSNNTYFITMEYVDGVNMKKVLEYHLKHSIFMDPAYAAFIMNEVCKGLAYAHSLKDQHGRALGVVHRDVSPPNILLSRQGEVKLVDFGLAKATSQLEHTEPGIIKGKFSYLSCEAAWGKEVDARADIFSAGIIFWEMLAGGRKLFLGETDYETVMLVRDAKVPPITSINPDVPGEFEFIIMKALQPDPDRRYQTATEMGRDIARAMFSLQKPVTAYDIGQMVEQIQKEEPVVEKKELDIVDRLIEDELARLSSIELGDNIFDEGSKPISVAEISGMLDSSLGMEDPRKWILEMEEDRGSGGFNVAKKGSGWQEVKIHDLENKSSVSSSLKRHKPSQASGFPVDLQKKKVEVKPIEGEEPKYTIWFILLFLSIIALGVAYYFLIFRK